MASPKNSGIHVAHGLGILPLQEAVLFPNTVIPLAVVKKPGILLVEEALREGKPIGLTVLKDRDTENPGPDDVQRIGTIGVIQKMLKVPDGTIRCIVAGQSVFKVDKFTQRDPYMVASYTELPDVTIENEELLAMQRNLGGLFQKLLSYLPQAPREMEMEVQNITDPNVLTYFVASTMRLDTADRQSLLEERNTGKRMRRLTLLLTKELEVVELGHKIQSDIQREMEKNQREFYLRQQLRAIQEELGEVDPQQAETNELRTKIDEAKMPEDVKKSADRELDRLSKVPQASPEYSVIRTYLDWLVTLPWDVTTSDNIDIKKSREILDQDHYDLEKIKDRIVEYLAVGKLKKKLTGPILCFVGPPGVGKTSLGQSIARAMGRKFVRLSVGGVRDEAEIRGHRRTYIGAMPGTIVRAMRDAGTKNPVMMIDEIDKVGADFRGDPQSALLEVLDPEQNHTFRDHYIDLPFDLSQVLFICTANSLDTISPPLRDRMEIIQLSGYTELEKLQIAKRYLVKKQRTANGLKETQAQVSDAALRAIINDYTREAGVRNLEREIGTVFRKVARKIAETARYKARVRPENLADILSKPRFFNEVRKRVASVGVATGMVWTSVGGDIVFIESTSMPGNGQTRAHRSARRRDERERASGRVVPALAFGRIRPSRRLLRKARYPHPRSRRGDAKGRPVRRHHDGDVDCVDADGSQSRPELGDDRRDYAHRASAADRRSQREGAGREACRDLKDSLSKTQRAGSRRHPERNPRLDDVRAGRRDQRSAASRARKTSHFAGAARRERPLEQRRAPSSERRTSEPPQWRRETDHGETDGAQAIGR